MGGLASALPGVAGSSSRACTAARWASQAPTGSSSTDGPLGSRMPAPADRKPGSHSVRWRTTSRAAQPATGDGASQALVPLTRSVNSRARWRCRSAGWSGRAIADHRLEFRVALVDACVHAAGQPGVPALDAVDQGLHAQPGAPVAEVIEPQRLQRDPVRLSLVGERLHDPVGPHLVEAAAEGVPDPADRPDEAPAAAGAVVPGGDPAVRLVRAH